VAFAVVVVAAAAVAIFSVARTHEEVAATALTLPTLIIAAFTLVLTIPKPAELKLIRPDEFGFKDLIFFVVPQPSPLGERQIPRDYLLQLTVVICNVGDRKAILSAVRLDGFKGRSGKVVRLPDAAQLAWRSSRRRRSAWQ
jgi:hypothetical protein